MLDRGDRHFIYLFGLFRQLRIYIYCIPSSCLDMLRQHLDNKFDASQLHFLGGRESARLAWFILSGLVHTWTACVCPQNFSQWMPSPTPGLNDLRDAFRLLDRDQNGTLDLQEPVMARFGP